MESAELDDLMVSRDGEGNRIPQQKRLKAVDKTIAVVKPNWGDAKAWSEEFGEDADAMDSEKIAKQFRKFVKDPDMSNVSGDDVDNMQSAVVQEILDILTREAGLSGEEEEVDQKN